MPERDPRKECGCEGGRGLRPIACTHFDGQVVCLWSSSGYFTACGPAPEPHMDQEGHLSCIPDYKMFDSVSVAEPDYARRAELLRLGEPAHA